MLETIVFLLAFVSFRSKAYEFASVCRRLDGFNQKLDSSDAPVLCVNNDILIKQADSSYDYFEGELVHVECLPLENVTLFFKNEGQVIYETKRTDSVYDDSVNMLVKLTSPLDGAMFQCSYPDRMLTIYMKMRSDRSPENHIEVNGFSLRPPRSAYYLNSYNERFNVTYNELNTSLEVFDFNSNGLSERKKYIEANEDGHKIIIELYPAFQLKGIHPYNIDAIIVEKSTVIQFQLDAVCESLCFDPYFIGLNLSKIQAKYKKRRILNIIIYELDLEEDLLELGCNSKFPTNIVTVDGKELDKEKAFKLFTKNDTESSQIINCTASDTDFTAYKSTLLKLTRKKKDLPRQSNGTELPTTPSDTNLGIAQRPNSEEVEFPATANNQDNTPPIQNSTDVNTPSSNLKIVPPLNDEESSNSGLAVTVVLATMVIAVISMGVTATIYVIKNNRTQRHDVNEDGNHAVIIDLDNISPRIAGTEEPATNINSEPMLAPPEETNALRYNNDQETAL